MKKTGNTYCFQDPPRVLSYASVVGKKEGEGPLSRDFDYISDDNTFGEGHSQLSAEPGSG